MKKTVLISAFACNPYEGTEPGYGWNFAIEMTKYFKVICLVREIDKFDIENEIKQLNLEGIEFHFVGLRPSIERLWKNKGISWYFYYIIWQYNAYKYASNLMRTTHFNYIHHITWGSLQLGSFMYKMGKPLIIGPMGGGQKTPKQLYPYLGLGIVQEFLRNITSYLLIWFNPGCYNSLKYAQYILCSNTETYDLAIKVRKKTDGVLLFPDTVLPNHLVNEGLLIERSFNSNITKILWVGSFLPRKGLELAIQVIDLAKDLVPIEVVFLGTGSTLEKIKKIVISKGLGDIVTFKGRVPFSKVGEWYKSSDLFLFTSYRESGGVQLLEALAFGLPVVCLDIHGPKIIVPKESSFKIGLTGDIAKNIANAIVTYHNLSINEKNRMSKFGIEYSKRNTWDNKVGEMVNLCYNNMS